jgi:hypothetical protein
MVVPFIVSPEIVPATVNFAFGVDVPIPTLPVNPLLDIFPVVLADQFSPGMDTVLPLVVFNSIMVPLTLPPDI